MWKRREQSRDAVRQAGIGKPGGASAPGDVAEPAAAGVAESPEQDTIGISVAGIAVRGVCVVVVVVKDDGPPERLTERCICSYHMVPGGRNLRQSVEGGPERLRNKV